MFCSAKKPSSAPAKKSKDEKPSIESDTNKSESEENTEKVFLVLIVFVFFLKISCFLKNCNFTQNALKSWVYRAGFS